MIKKIVQICTRWLSYYLFLGIYSILSILRTQWARKFQATAIKLKLKYPNHYEFPLNASGLLIEDWHSLLCP